MEIRKGKKEDIKRIISIIKSATSDMESENIMQWDDLYPNEEVITNDIIEENLFVYEEDGIIKGIITLNEFQDIEYKEINWQYTKGKSLVIHRVCIDPRYKGNGIATSFLKYAELLGKEKGYESIRLDTFTLNKYSCRLYAKNGYEKRGIITFRKGEFFCFEKVII
ncbi:MULTISPECIES: GNAT family N-acetyltransferase [Clostridium]|uniref:GNAT family N-acetyltransferase n=1 Tax=Clostridium cibarium TaxID=2762247 RepID=A0ABR8PZ31_9CLOT|nr:MULTISPECIES: GNAT family N-acetyltransferase [Clostridium]MBD7913426.1 GNAT family N-acetyltransferase [Clostridium cibarium]